MNICFSPDANVKIRSMRTSSHIVKQGWVRPRFLIIAIAAKKKKHCPDVNCISAFTYTLITFSETETFSLIKV